MATVTTGENIHVLPDTIRIARYTKLSLIENELHDTKTLLRTQRKIVSLKGLLKGTHITGDEIETAKKSLFKHV
ncbi:hypothetical protein DRO03_02725 [Methanosarcinales archaeon]|nr:MAG: hypothetical protein DRO03_02725 [Methanosarcinales archaeon]